MQVEFLSRSCRQFEQLVQAESWFQPCTQSGLLVLVLELTEAVQEQEMQSQRIWGASLAPSAHMDALRG